MDSLLDPDGGSSGETVDRNSFNEALKTRELRELRDALAKSGSSSTTPVTASRRSTNMSLGWGGGRYTRGGADLGGDIEAGACALVVGVWMIVEPSPASC